MSYIFSFFFFLWVPVNCCKWLIIANCSCQRLSFDNGAVNNNNHNITLWQLGCSKMMLMLVKKKKKKKAIFMCRCYFIFICYMRIPLWVRNVAFCWTEACCISKETKIFPDWLSVPTLCCFTSTCHESLGFQQPHHWLKYLCMRINAFHTYDAKKKSKK